MKILGIGNAIVDVICKVEENFLSENNFSINLFKLLIFKPDFIKPACPITPDNLNVGILTDFENKNFNILSLIKSYNN